MNGSEEMHVDPNAAFDPFATPNPSLTPQPDLDSTITITLGMWNHLINRLSAFETRSNNLERALETLDSSHNTLKNRHNTLEHEYYERAVLTHRNNHQEPKIPDPPMFSGERKELLSFLTKCQIKFDGQPSRFPNERSKILYAGSRLEGPAFSWFQPLISQYPAGSEESTPPELTSFKAFTGALTTIYGDPNLEATAVREIRRLHQTGSAAEYAAKFESKKQYMHWNDEALRDQFYLNLKEELKDEIAPVGKPQTYLELKNLAIRLDARLFERRLERGPSASTTRPPPAKPTARPFTWSAPSAHPAPTPPPTTTPRMLVPPSSSLKAPSQSADGTTPMELDAGGFWHLTEAERSRRRTLGLCGYCGERGHPTSTCPVAPPFRESRPSRQNRSVPHSNRQAAMTFELSHPDMESEKDNTQE
jgi:hypothetical protein